MPLDILRVRAVSLISAFSLMASYWTKSTRYFLQDTQWNNVFFRCIINVHWMSRLSCSVIAVYAQNFLQDKKKKKKENLIVRCIHTYAHTYLHMYTSYSTYIHTYMHNLRLRPSCTIMCLTLKFSVTNTSLSDGCVAGKVFVVISFLPFQLASDFVSFGSGSAPDL